MHPQASGGLSLAFAAVAIAVASLFVYGNFAAGEALGEPASAKRRAGTLAAIGAVAWMAITGGAALAGALARFDARPPPFVVMFVATLAVALGVGLSRVGGRLARGLPLAALVGAQAFRLPLELAMHEAARQGVMPERMSFGGVNFDIATGALAVPLAVALARGAVARALVVAWNALGALLLANVVANAILATPMIHAFGTDPRDVNTFVAYFPFVWLPTVMVAAAIAGHVIVARRLALDGRVRQPA